MNEYYRHRKLNIGIVNKLKMGKRKDSTHFKLKDLFPFELRKTLSNHLCVRFFSSSNLTVPQVNCLRV